MKRNKKTDMKRTLKGLEVVMEKLREEMQNPKYSHFEIINYPSFSKDKEEVLTLKVEYKGGGW